MNRERPSDRHLARVRWPLRRAVVGKDPGGWRSVGGGEGMELATVREYSNGDDPRRINWTATARTGSLHVVVPVAERSLTTLLALDATGSMSTGTHRSKFEVACEAVDTLTRIATRYSDRFDFVTVNDEVRRVPVKQGRRALLATQDALVATEPRGSEKFAEVLLRAMRSRPGLLIAVSDWRDPDDRAALRHCSALTDMVVVRVVDPAERELPRVGLLTVVDPETGRQMLLDTRDDKLQRIFSEKAAELEADFAAATGACPTVLEVSTDADHGGFQVVQQLLRTTRRRR